MNMDRPRRDGVALPGTGPAETPHAEDLTSVAATFDARAASYVRNGWHRECAERLVAVCPMRRGDRVLDAATGTGFAALAAARKIGPAGSVLGVDISAGMLAQARAAIAEAGLATIAVAAEDATALPGLGGASFDAVICAAGLLYMDHGAALAEWHRLLAPGGVVAFSSMAAGSPPAGRLFRECARAFGLRLDDPSEVLGSRGACAAALEAAGYTVVQIVSESIVFSAQDLSLAWESNSRSARHAAVQQLAAADREALRTAYLAALAREQEASADAFGRSGVLYAVGRR